MRITKYLIHRSVLMLMAFVLHEGILPANAEDQANPSVVSLDGSGWSIATDPNNMGRGQRWFDAPRQEAKPTKVPWIIQDVFPAYQGVAWYWREFTPPANPHSNGRYLLKFHAVDYAAEVWLNGAKLGSHEGGETPFVLDATDAVKPNGANLLAVRVLNPSTTPIDGITLDIVPHGVKKYPIQGGGVYNVGGIVDSVELHLTPAVRISDMFVRPDIKTGAIRVDLTVRNALHEPIHAEVFLSVANAAGGPTLVSKKMAGQALAGDTIFTAHLNIPNPRLWNLDDPHLYRVTARLSADGGQSCDEQSTRCGFRDFRFENGYFRLNGRRIFPRGPLNLIQYPIGHLVPTEPDHLRRDVLAMKAMGMNICRACFGGIKARQLDVYDELGVMVYMENYGGWLVKDSQYLEKWTDQAMAEVVLRDRNHPSVVAWGLLNETPKGRLFEHAVGMLPLVRSLDDTRMVFLSSGRWDWDYSIGSLCNPGSMQWGSTLHDHHWYPDVPHSAETIRGLRTLGSPEAPMFLSEYGTGNAVNLPRYARQFEQRGADQAEDARYYKYHLDCFLRDWKDWKMEDTWPRPEDFFEDSDRTMARLRETGENALRANPNLVGQFFCAITDSDFDGVGVLNLFREFKQASFDVMADVWAPLRWCVFAEPVNAYRGSEIQLEAVLANEDVLRPGVYPARVQIVGPQNRRVFEKTFSVTIPEPDGNRELSMALPAFSEKLLADWPSGRYRMLVTFEHGAAPTGGKTEFYIADPNEMPHVAAPVSLWGRDPELEQWLLTHNIRTIPLSASPVGREVILVGKEPMANAGIDAYKDIARRIATGSTALFLCPEVFAKGDNSTAWLPISPKGAMANLNECNGYFRCDVFSKKHPIFEGLPSGGIMDYAFYREIIPQIAWVGLPTPAEVVAAGIRVQMGYRSGLMASVHELGAGRMILNTLKIRENLGPSPVAERLLRNMINFAARDADKPLVPIPAGFEEQLDALYSD